MVQFALCGLEVDYSVFASVVDDVRTARAG